MFMITTALHLATAFFHCFAIYLFSFSSLPGVTAGCVLSFEYPPIFPCIWNLTQQILPGFGSRILRVVWMDGWMEQSGREHVH